MFAPRLRAARDRALDLSLRRLLPSGSLGPELDDPVAYHRLPLALAATGHLAAARRVLQRIERRYLCADGDIRATTELRSVDPDCDESAVCMHALLSLGAVRAGSPALAERFDNWLDRLRAEKVSGTVPLHGPGVHDGITDLPSTVRVAMVDLARGRTPDWIAHASWLMALWSSQPHRDAVFLRRDGNGGLVTLWAASAPGCHAIPALGPGSGHGILGEALSFLAATLPMSAPPLRDDLLLTSRELIDFALRCDPHVRHPCDQATLAMGLAQLSRATRDEDGRDLAVRLSLRACEQWQPDGFGPSDEDEHPAVRFDRTVFTAYALHETLAALDEMEPLRDERAPPAGWRVVLCNVPELKAHEIADALVRERLAACVNAINPVRSTYVWKGSVERESEVTLLIKTTSDRIAALTARIRALHPYELPEVIALAVEGSEGHLPYLDWVRSQVTPDDEDPRIPPAS